MRPSRGFVAFLAGMGLTAASALPISFAESLLVPGILIAMGLGVGTIHEPGKWGGAWTLAVIYLGSFLVWGAVAYVVASLLARKRVA
jgi:hypothetical protein